MKRVQGELYTAKKSKSVRSPRSPPKSAIVRTNSVFYSVLVVMLLLFLRIYQNLSTDFPILFLLNITTRGVRHHSPLTTSLSLPFVRWTCEGLLARRSVHTLFGQWSPAVSTPFVWPFFLSILTDTVLHKHFAWSPCLSILTDIVLYKL